MVLRRLQFRELMNTGAVYMAWGLFVQKVQTLSIQLTVVHRFFHPRIGVVFLGPTYDKFRLDCA
jgi:hypothetical protein